MISNLESMYIRYDDSIIKISNHPYSKSLLQNENLDPEKNPQSSSPSEDLYNEAISKSKAQLKKSTAGWSAFLKLKDNIILNGFIINKSEPIIFKKQKDKYYCSHGRHRICILYVLYGGNIKLNLKKKHKGWEVIEIIYPIEVKT